MTRIGWYRTFTVVHRYLGLFTLIFLLSAAVTGCVLIFFNQLDANINPDLYRAVGAGPTLSASRLAAIVERNHPNIMVASLPLHVDPRQNVLMRVIGRSYHSIGFNEVFVDPHTGSVVGRRDDESIKLDRHHLMPLIYLFHFELLGGTPGRWLMGIVALLWLIELIVGFYLTIPQRRPFWRQWKNSWKIRRPRKLLSFLLDVHRAIGLWLLPGLVVLAVTGFALNFYYEAVQPVVLAISPRDPSPLYLPGHNSAAAKEPTLGFAKAVQLGKVEAARLHPALKAAFVTYDPLHGVYGVNFTPTGRQVYRDSGPVAYYFDDQSGRFVVADDPTRDSAGQALLRTIFPLHSGQIAGPASETFVFLLGLSIVGMCVSGLIMWWRRRPVSTSRRHGKSVSSTESPRT